MLEEIAKILAGEHLGLEQTSVRGRSDITVPDLVIGVTIICHHLAFFCYL
jgi:hypothetical protein